MEIAEAETWKEKRKKKRDKEKKVRDWHDVLKETRYNPEPNHNVSLKTASS